VRRSDLERFIEVVGTNLMARHRLVNEETKGILPGTGGFSGFKVGRKPLVAYVGYAKKQR